MSFGLEESTEKTDDEIDSPVTETGEMPSISPFYLSFASADAAGGTSVGSQTDSGNAGFVATMNGTRSLEGGQSVVARFPESAVHLFDTESGRTLKNRSLDQLEESEPRL